jgi:hypothetical protein|tara:strand:+ start:50 stop:580 length:531 start_codon:yes stop_codon:yes gene_type:complete
MSDNEKVYLESAGKNVRVTSSRVVLGDKNFVLRNISAVQVFSQKLKMMGIAFCILFILVGLWAGSEFESLTVTIIFIGIGLLYLLFKDKHFVQVSSGGTPTNTIHSPTTEFPNQVVEAINNALLDLDNNRTSEESTDESDSSGSSADEILKLKQLLDAGAITQEEYDAKKKELLDL